MSSCAKFTDDRVQFAAHYLSSNQLKSTNKNALLSVLEADVYGELYSSLYSRNFQFNEIGAKAYSIGSSESDSLLFFDVAIVAGEAKNFVVEFEQFHEEVFEVADGYGQTRRYGCRVERFQNGGLAGVVRLNRTNLGVLDTLELPIQFVLPD